MSDTKLSFLKIIVGDLEISRKFYEVALDFAVANRFDTPDFAEVIMRQAESGCGLILLSYKDGRALADAAGHGPTGFVTQNIEAAHERLISAGAMPMGAVLEVEGGIKVAFVSDPDGHEIELCQFP